MPYPYKNIFLRIQHFVDCSKSNDKITLKKNNIQSSKFTLLALFSFNTFLLLLHPLLKQKCQGSFQSFQHSFDEIAINFEFARWKCVFRAKSGRFGGLTIS